ncbi:glutamate synthase subunit beta [Bacteroidota bacterium]
MADPKGFIKIERKEAGNRPLRDRVHDYGEVEQTLNSEDRKLQASRCMDCGIPFCHWACPVINVIPEFNEQLYKGEWKKASEVLQSTNNFPEFTGRICPAPCEDACVLTIDKSPVTIRENEAAITEMAFREGYLKPQPPSRRTGKKVAVIGSGPAGLACADQLNKSGHLVRVFEKEDEAGGLLRYGIPDFKLNKDIVDRRLNILLAEGIEIQTGKEIGRNLDIKELVNSYDAVCIAIGAEEPRDLPVKGRDLDGIHFAMDYLRQQNKVNRGLEIPYDYQIHAKDKNVVVLGGGDTGSDCVGTAVRQGAKSITQIEILPRPTEIEGKENPNWPFSPQKLKTSTSHEEGCQRKWSLSTRKFMGEMQHIIGLELIEVEWVKNEKGQMQMKEIPGTELVLEADLVLLSMGFVHPVQAGIIDALELKVNARKNIVTDSRFTTSHEKVFAAGDARNGASLVVTAIYSGREAASAIDDYLRKS